MSAGGYAAGLLFLVVILGGSLGASEITLRRRLAHLRGAPRVAAQAILTTLAVALTVLLPGCVGLLTRTSAALTALALPLLSLLLPYAGRGRPSRDLASPARFSASSMVVAGAAVFLSGAFFVGELVHTVRTPYTAVDFTSYDLPVIGTWIQSHSIWPITELFPLQTHGTYPQNAHLVIAAIVLAFHNDALLRPFVYLYLPLLALAVYGIAREVGSPRSTAAALAAAFSSVPLVAVDVEVGPPDSIALAMFALGLLFLIRRLRNGTASDLFLAALGLGFAAGSLWYFASAVAVVLVIWMADILVRSSLRHGAKEIAGVVALSLACAIVWPLRNWTGAADPVFPVNVHVGAISIFHAPPDQYRAISGFSIAQYLSHAHVMAHYIFPAWVRALGLPGLASIAVGVVAGTVLTFKQRAGHMRFLLIATLILSALYLVTPYSAFGPRDHPSLAWVNVRYLFPAAVTGMALVAGMMGTLSPRVRRFAELCALVATVQGLYEAHHLLGTTLSALAVGAIVTVFVALAVVLGWQLTRRDTRAKLRPAVGASVALACLVGGYVIQRSFSDTGYAIDDPTFAWIDAHAQPIRVGLVGSWNFAGVSPAWPMFGRTMQNPVRYVGRLRGDHLTQYGTHADWLRAVRNGRFQLLEVARNKPEPATSDADVVWAEEAGHVLARSHRFELIGVDPSRVTAR